MKPPTRVFLTDLYQLTMLQGYFDEGMEETVVFEFFVRKLPLGLPESLRRFRTVSAHPVKIPDALTALARTVDEKTGAGEKSRGPG